jgi:acyl-CoA synthetase (AMP-forming)/AMP-acid ligase II
VHCVRSGDVLITALPLFHIFALQVTLSLRLRAGATVVTTPRFDLEDIPPAGSGLRVTRTEVATPIVLALARHHAVPICNVPSLRLITSGAAPFGVHLARECAAHLGCWVKQYGMTELGGGTHFVSEIGGGDPASARSRARRERPASDNVRHIAIAACADVTADDAVQHAITVICEQLGPRFSCWSTMPVSAARSATHGRSC